jgi:hypothetical protein
MKYLDPTSIKATINANRIIEQLIGKDMLEGFPILRFVSMYKSESEFCISVHEVHDERDVENKNIYYFTHFDPDSPEGMIHCFSNYTDLTDFLKSIGGNIDKFLMQGNLQEELMKFM